MAEAGSKYILSKVDIDEIIVLGTGATYSKGDELQHIELSEFSDYSAQDIDKLSEYSFFRYRIAQYIHELDIEGVDIYADIDPQRREELLAIYNEFLAKAPESGMSADGKKDRMFSGNCLKHITRWRRSATGSTMETTAVYSAALMI